jgi:hypothetical protein
MDQNQTHTPEQVQQAKDFIWEHLSPIAQEFWIDIAALPEQERKSRYTKKIMAYLSADLKDGVITQEFAVLSIPETFQNYNTAASSQT